MGSTIGSTERWAVRTGARAPGFTAGGPRSPCRPGHRTQHQH
ncbi:hypothetical protein ACFFRL_05015 [Agromyces hippuratus]